MAYVEFLRVRRALIIYAIVIIVNVALLTASLHAGHVWVQSDTSGLRGHHDLGKVPLSVVLVAAAFGSLVFGTLISGSLNRERDTLPLSWTRPISRERLGLSCMLVDFAAVVAAFVITLGLGLIPLATTGILARVYPDGHAVVGVVLMLGVTVMWYGLVQAATSWFRGRAGLTVGLSWALFFFLMFLGHQAVFGPIVQGVANALNYLNPLAYASSYGRISTGQVDVTSYLMLPESVRTVATWSIGIVACAIAIFAWKRSEA